MIILNLNNMYSTIKHFQLISHSQSTIYTTYKVLYNQKTTIDNLLLDSEYKTRLIFKESYNDICYFKLILQLYTEQISKMHGYIIPRC